MSDHLETEYTDTKGHFKKGNPGGTGNPNILIQMKYRKAIAQAVTAKDLKEILKKLVEKAKNGDNIAAKIIIERCLGKVPKEVNVNTQGLQPVSISFQEVKSEPTDKQPAK